MGKLLEFLQDLVKSCNVFTAPVNLRYKLETDYSTFSGGILSIVLFLLLMSIFSNNWMALLSKTDISANIQNIREVDPPSIQVNSNDFMFAIGVNNLNLTDNHQKKYFKLKAIRTQITRSPQITKTVTLLNMEPCTENHWEQLGSEFLQTFHRQTMSSYLCVPRNYIMDLQGKYTSQKFVYYKFSLEKCFGQSDCRTKQEIDAWVNVNSSFTMNFYYSNTLINPFQQNSVSRIFQDKDYMTFSPGLSMTINLYMGSYEMETDESLFPFEQIQNRNGFIINKEERDSLSYIPNETDSYCKLFLRKSSSKIHVSRTYRKLDDMLSYIGGLFGIIATFFGFFMKYYGQCCFQFEMCQKVFNYQNKKQKFPQPKQTLHSKFNNNNNKIVDSSFYFQKNQQNHHQINEPIQSVIEPKDFGFLDFLVYNIFYVPLKKLYNLKWKRMQIYGDSLEEMRYKLDISQLMQKLTFYDRSINSLFDESQLKLLHLQEKFNFQQVRDERKLLGLRKEVLDNIFGGAIQTLKVLEQQDNPTILKKRDLKQIAFERSHTKIRSFIGVPTMNFFDFWAQSKSNKQDETNIPSDIKKALKDLDWKMQNGDQVSTRIYYGLEYELLDAFQKTKSVQKFIAQNDAAKKRTQFRLRSKESKLVSINVKEVEKQIEEVPAVDEPISPIEAEICRLKV